MTKATGYAKMPGEKHEEATIARPTAMALEKMARKAAKKAAEQRENIEQGEKLLALLNIRR